VIRLLIVDDHEVVREGLKSILASEPDLEVVGEASDANELETLVETTHPDVVLLDARLPGVGGAEACRRLSQNHPDVDVIIVSTFSDDDLVDECIIAGAKGYVIKDIERFDLTQSIRAVHRGEGAIAPSVAGRLLGRMRANDGTIAPAGSPLTAQQHEILRLIGEGFSNREIAEKVYLSENTVKSHVQEIFRKLEVRNRVEAAVLANRRGWI
jgi:two-component system, NarL family, response regulator DevR